MYMTYMCGGAAPQAVVSAQEVESTPRGGVFAILKIQVVKLLLVVCESQNNRKLTIIEVKLHQKCNFTFMNRAQCLQVKPDCLLSTLPGGKAQVLLNYCDSPELGLCV